MEATAAVVVAMHGRITILKRNQTYLAQTNVPSPHSAAIFSLSPTHLPPPTMRAIGGGYSHNDDNNNNNRNSSNNAENIPRGMF